MAPSRCPNCRSDKDVIRKGFYEKKSTRQMRVQRYQCNACSTGFSDQTFDLTYREIKPHLTQPVFRLLCSGVSQRRVAWILGTSPRTVSRKLVRLGEAAKLVHRSDLLNGPQPTSVIFDEMETFEHTKLKPLSITVAVEEKSKRLLFVHTVRMPPKGLLAKRARRIYGHRTDERPNSLKAFIRLMDRLSSRKLLLKSDQNPRYPGFVKKLRRPWEHVTFKGRRGCVVGQGELKEGGFDPLFDLNHTAAMIRDNLKTMSRRTWCTVKRVDRLQSLLNLFVVYYNNGLQCSNRLVRIQTTT